MSRFYLKNEWNIEKYQILTMEKIEWNNSHGCILGGVHRVMVIVARILDGAESMNLSILFPAIGKR